MSSNERGPWAIVLAANGGATFVTADARATLMRLALARASRIAPPERTIVVVTASERALQEGELSTLPPTNVLVEPRDRGSAPSILLGVIEAIARDPEATVALVPASHHVADEETLAAALEQAVVAAEWDPVCVAVLGATPDGADADYGWIQPRHGGPISGVRRLLDRPDAKVARELLAAGALWNTQVVAAKANTLLELYASAMPALASAFVELVAGGPDTAELARVYESLAREDFSERLLARSIDRLRVVAVPPCGWSDLGASLRQEEPALAGDDETTRLAPAIAQETTGAR